NLDDDSSGCGSGGRGGGGYRSGGVMVMQKSVVEDVRVDTMVVEVATRKEEVVVDTVGVGYGYGEGV
ncbi:unnamed protein product, partial [Brassica oleracea var. botrytis]